VTFADTLVWIPPRRRFSPSQPRSRLHFSTQCLLSAEGHILRLGSPGSCTVHRYCNPVPWSLERCRRQPRCSRNWTGQFSALAFNTWIKVRPAEMEAVELSVGAVSRATCAKGTIWLIRTIQFDGSMESDPRLGMIAVRIPLLADVHDSDGSLVKRLPKRLRGAFTTACIASLRRASVLRVC
jgi:hypothetical protein